MAKMRKKKYESGEGARFMTRARAMRKLQLSLKEFRKLCILKGIYPREPTSRKRAQRGQGGIQTLYHTKDIQFLLHEPIIHTFRQSKVHGRKVGRAKSLGDHKEMMKLLRDRPTLRLDHIVKERYPTFVDAIRDLDDCLTLCFLFSTFPIMPFLKRDQTNLCRRLTLEFMHVIIASSALRKVFVSIKGYYFQADIKGVTVTWIVPHQFSFEPQTREEVDFHIMSTFVEFYVVLLGFVNFRLYSEFNLKYPPVFSAKTEGTDARLVDREALQSERVATLTTPLAPVTSRRRLDQGASDQNPQPDTFDLAGSVEEAEEIKKEAERLERLKTLFSETKIFLSREVPREVLTFTLRCCGASAISWDTSLFIGASFSEDDETITHQISDRPSVSKQYISRYYVQPQWVFDSVNAGELLPVEKYLVGCVLPPHLSPFKEKIHVQYQPPQEGESSDPVPDKIKVIEEKKDSGNEKESDTEKSDDSEEEEEEEDSDDEERAARNKLTEKMEVKRGKVEVVDPEAKKKEDWQEFKLREKMVEKKHRALYKSMMRGRLLRNYDVKVLKRKRKMLDEKKKKMLNKTNQHQSIPASAP